jgi:hypothetical protein
MSVCISSPEVEFAEHVRENIDNDMIIEVNMLNLECCFADDLRILVVCGIPEEMIPEFRR